MTHAMYLRTPSRACAASALVKGRSGENTPASDLKIPILQTARTESIISVCIADSSVKV